MTRRQLHFLPSVTRTVPWEILWRACIRQWKRWFFAVGGALLGAGAALWWGSDGLSSYEQTRQAMDIAITRWQVQPLPSPKNVTPSTHAAGALWPRLTDNLPAEIWIDLQQALMAQGVEVVSLRLLPDVMAGPLHGQKVAMRLNASFSDWVSAWRWVADSGPLLSVDRLSAAPRGTFRGAQLDVVLHLWFKPDPVGDEAGFTKSYFPPPFLHKNAGRKSASEIFSQEGLSAVAQPPALDSALPIADPLHGPMDRMRLLGTWRQGAQWHAVLSVGGAWIPVQVGRRIALEGHMVESIHPDVVILRSAQGQKLELKWPGGGR